MNKEPKENREGNIKEKPVITRATQVAIMKFFLRTSIPRILKEQEEKKT